MTNEDGANSNAGNNTSLGEHRNPYRFCAPDHFRTRLHVSYDGTDFSGWQRQNSAVLTTVQGTLEAALTKIYDKPIRVLGASRTDAGVHANLQVAHFDAPKDPSAFDLRYALQCLTPESLVVKDVLRAPNDFHAIACVTDKVYKYRVLNRRFPSALRHRTTHWVRFPLDLNYLNATAEYLVGRHDFKSFQSAGTPVQTTVRTMTVARWEKIDEDTLEFTVQGDGFLKQMVRNMVGTMIDLNQEGLPPSRIRDIMATLDRRKAGPTAPPQGLFLTRVNYPKAFDEKCVSLTSVSPNTPPS
jgi:tRNA pseudouridine38-40 synthase